MTVELWAAKTVGNFLVLDEILPSSWCGHRFHLHSWNSCVKALIYFVFLNRLFCNWRMLFDFHPRLLFQEALDMFVK
jgi:hypothetical protein